MRPTIRPVRLSSPPPPPSPPRRRSSGISARLAPVEAARIVEDDELETGTVTVEPSTLSLNRPTPLVLAELTPRAGGSVVDLSFDDETQARPVDDRLLDTMRRDVVSAADLGVAYESLPSLEMRGPFDSFESSRSEASRLSPTERHEESSEAELWGSREDSGPRERPQAPRAHSTMPPRGEESFEAPVIPLSPRLPDELRSQFERGVQPLRTPTPEAWAPVRAQASMPDGASYASAPSAAAYFNPNASYPPGSALPQYVPGQLHPAPAYASGPYARLASHELANRAQPVGGQLVAPPSQASKVGRFAWFVAGAAFGITFAFFATGFFSGARSVDLRAASPLPAATQVAPAVAPAAVAPPVAQVQALVAPPVAQVQALVAPPVAQALVAPPVAQAPVAQAPQRAAMRTSSGRRFVAPAQPSGPRPLPGSGETEAPAAPIGGANIGDLLGAGLNP